MHEEKRLKAKEVNLQIMVEDCRQIRVNVDGGMNFDGHPKRVLGHLGLRPGTINKATFEAGEIIGHLAGLFPNATITAKGMKGEEIEQEQAEKGVREAWVRG